MTSLLDWEYWQNDWPQRPVVYTRANAADAFPNPMTPLSLDLIVKYEDAGAHFLYEQILRALRPSDAPDPFVRAVYGLVYFDAEQLAAIGDGVPGTTREDLYQQFFGLSRDPSAPKPKVDRRKELSSAVRVLPRLIHVERTLPARIARLTARIRAQRPSSPHLGLDECRRWLARLDAEQVECWWVLTAAAMLVGAHYELLSKVLARWADDDSGELLNRLHVNLGGNESAEAGRAAAALARLAREEGGSVHELRAAGPRFQAAFDQAIDRFGHRGPCELELARPSWRADSSKFLELIAAHSNVAEVTTPNEPDADAELARRLSRWQRPLVGALLARSRAWMPRRENAKTPLTVLWDELRRLTTAAADQLVASGRLENAEDVHYLRRVEFDRALAGEGVPDAAEIVRRRDAHARCAAVDLPEVILVGPRYVGPVDDEYFTSRGFLPPAVPDQTASTLDGLGVAAGVARGRARIMGDADEEFEPGDILIAHTVDPGWSPVIAIAGGMVLDVGGPMSHGAVVSRELGIPCVINVKTATRVVRDATEIVVDGNAGVVHLEPRP